MMYRGDVVPKDVNASVATIKTTIHHAASHVLTMARVTFYHLRCWLKDGVCNLSHGQLLVVRFLGRDDWSIAGQHEVNTRVRDEIGLKFCNVNIQRSVEAKRCC